MNIGFVSASLPTTSDLASLRQENIPVHGRALPQPPLPRQLKVRFTWVWWLTTMSAHTKYLPPLAVFAYTHTHTHRHMQFFFYRLALASTFPDSNIHGHPGTRWCNETHRRLQGTHVTTLLKVKSGVLERVFVVYVGS
ncbi:hypothetical protein LX32DRAFT_126177 [Colletotrichum zoysiae]|uniref:Uncharacterized protein n=1 Tax=Colletotrichum zoysiae TaxID=1216348 RepID=A0AAD9LVP0_9PEZI|nr:hypothetical protein LX32DRAFT_126177 [Colletotrichum zoysiae]